MSKNIDELLSLPYWVIDPLPEQVPENCSGQFFAVEKYFLEEEQLRRIKQKHIDIILKLNCYRHIFIGEEAVMNPPPEQIAEEMRQRRLLMMVDDSLIISEPDDLCMTVYNPDEKLLELIRTLAAGEGLFVWQPPRQ